MKAKTVNPRGWHYTEETERRKWQNPEAVLREIGIKPGSVFVDIGCGAGFFALPAARIAGPGGKVYGVDANSAGIEEIRRKAAAEGLTNLELKVGKAEETVFCRDCADFVFFGIVLHDFQDPAKVLENAHRMMKPGGKLVNLDWKKIEMGFGPPFSKRFDEAAASRLIKTAKFEVESVKDSGEFFYLIIASTRKTVGAGTS